MMPTSTLVLPFSNRYEPSTVAPICCMSHCRSASGSASVPGSAAMAAATGEPLSQLHVGLGGIELLDLAGVDDEIGDGADDAVLGRAHEGVLGVGGGGEVAVGGDDGGDADVGVLGDDRAAGRGDRGTGGVERHALGVDDDELLFTGFLQGAGVVGRCAAFDDDGGGRGECRDRCPKDELSHE